MKPQTYAAHPTSPARVLPSSPSSTNINRRSIFHKATYWDGVAQGVKQEFRSSRLKALEEINEVIKEAIFFNEALPRPHLDEALQMIYRLCEARAQDHGDMDQLERDFTKFASSTLRQLQQQGGGAEGSNNSSSTVRYGGPMGRTIFRTIKAHVMVPILTSFLSKFSEQTSGLEYEPRAYAMEVFLHSFLELAGKERGRIAEASATQNFEEFGRLYEGAGRLADAVCPESGWKPWQTMMLEKIGEVISPAWEEFRKNHKDDLDPWDFFPFRGELLLQKENVSLHLGKEDGERIGRLVDSRKGEGWTHFKFKWSVQKEMEKASISPIEVTEIACIHPSRGLSKAESVIAEGFLDVLRWTHDPQQLQDKLAGIFYDMSNTTTADRGFASMSEATIEAAARLHGYTIEFSPDWTPPDHPQPDQYALSAFDDRDSFIQAARKNMILRKIDVA